MNKEKDNLDIFIENAIKEKLNDVHISNKEIELEWRKLQVLRSNRETCASEVTPGDKKKTFANKYMKIAAVIVIAFLSLTAIDLLMGKKSIALKTSIFQNIVTSQNGSTIQIGTEEDEDNPPTVGNADIKITNIEQAKEFILFDFYQLPYDLTKIVISSPKKNPILYLTYNTDEGEIVFKQFLEGIKRSETIEVAKDGLVQKFQYDSIEWVFITFPDIYSNLIWSQYGVNYSLDFDYEIFKEQSIDIIKAMR